MGVSDADRCKRLCCGVVECVYMVVSVIEECLDVRMDVS